MVNPIASVNAKSLLTVELTITPTTGEPSKILISEGCKFTNLKYLESGKEVVVSGVCKVIKWNYIKLPENKNCVHETVSRFSSQCMPTSMVVDCSSEYQSDIREIPIMAVRACEEVEDANGTVSPKPPVSGGDDVLARVQIAGDVDEGGRLSNAVVTVTLAKAVVDEDVDEFVATSKITISNTPVDAALADLDIVWLDDTVFKFELTEEFVLPTMIQKGATATLVSGDATGTYDLTKDDVPEYSDPEGPDLPPEETEVTLVDVTVADGKLSFTLEGAETDPCVVVLNEKTVLKGFDAEENEEGQKVYSVAITGNDLFSTGNTLHIHGTGYELDAEPFDGIPAVVPTADALAADVAAVLAEVKKAANAATCDVEALSDASYVKILKGVPADLIVTGVQVSDVVYNGGSYLNWYLNDDDEFIGSPAYMVESGNVSVSALALMQNVSADGTVDVKVLVEGVTARGRAKVTDYVIGTITLSQPAVLNLAGTSAVNAVEGYTSTVTQNAAGITLTREERSTQVKVVLTDADSNLLPEDEVAYVTIKDGGLNPLYITKVGTGVILPCNHLDGIVNDDAETTRWQVAVATVLGSVGFGVTINDVARPKLAISNVAIDGDIDFDGIVSNYEISFEVTPKNITKATIANAKLNVYGTVLTNIAVGAISTLIEVTNGVVVIRAAEGDTLDVSGIKKGTVATLTVGDETAIASNVSVPVYVAPVLRGITLTGDVDFVTGVIETGALEIRFDKETDISKMKLYITDLGFDGTAIGTMTGVTTEGVVITVPVSSVNVKLVQEVDVITATIKRGGEEFKYAMNKGSNYPTWEKPPVVSRVELTGSMDEATGMINNPVIKVTFDKAADLSEATVSISELGITDVALAGDDVLMVGAVANVTLSAGVSVVNAPTEGITATVVNKTMTQTYAMVADTDYPTWTAPEEPAELTRVEITGEMDDSSIIASATIKVTFDKEVDLSAATLTIANIAITDVALSGEGAVTEESSVSVTVESLDMSGVTADGLIATVTNGDDTYTYSMVATTDYPFRDSTGVTE